MGPSHLFLKTAMIKSGILIKYRVISYLVLSVPAVSEGLSSSLH